MPKKGVKRGQESVNNLRISEWNERERAANEEKNRKLAIVLGAMAEQGYTKEAKSLSETRKAQHSQFPLMGFIKNLEGPKGRTSLMYAARIGDLERFQQLLEAGANVTKEDDVSSVLTYAASGEIDTSNKHVKPQHSEIIRLIAQKIPVDTRSGAYEGYPNSGVTPLMVACVFKHFAAVQTLCELGADVNARSQNGFTPISATCNFDNDDDEELSEELKSRIKFDDTSKHIIDYLLTQGANINDVDDRGTTCLMRLASIKGNSDGLLFLLSPSRGADPTMLDNRGNSALAYACDSGDAEHISILGHSINPNVERNHENKTLLMRMASGDYSKWSSSLKALLDLKDDEGNMLIELEARNTQGLTALHLAAKNGNTEAVRDLCDAGANVNAHDNDGDTTLLILITNVQWIQTPSEKVKEIFDLLLSRGADPDIPSKKGGTLEMYINAQLRDEELKESLLARIAQARAARGGPVAAGNRLGGGGGAQGGGSRKMKVRRTRGKGKKAKAKAKSKTRKARS